MVVSDMAKNMFPPEMCNSVVAGVSWGVLLPSSGGDDRGGAAPKAPFTWALAYSKIFHGSPVGTPDLLPPSTSPASYRVVDGKINNETILKAGDIITYSDFVECVLKNKRLKNTFTNPGNPGVALRKEYDALLQKLSLPKDLLGEIESLKGEAKQQQQPPQSQSQSQQGAKTAATQPATEGKGSAENAVASHAARRVIPHGLQSGYRFLIPSFFKFLLHLQSEGRDFAILFRTFGYASTGATHASCGQRF